MQRSEEFGPIHELLQDPNETDVSTSGEVRRVAQIEFAEVSRRILNNEAASEKLSEIDKAALKLIEQSLAGYKYEGRGFREYEVDLHGEDDTVDTIAPTPSKHAPHKDFVMINATNPHYTRTTPVQNFQFYYPGKTAEGPLKDANISCTMYAYTFGFPQPKRPYDYLSISNMSTDRESGSTHHQVISCYVFDADNNTDNIEDEVEQSFGESGRLEGRFNQGTAKIVQNYRSAQDHRTYHREYDLIDLGIIEMDGGKRTIIIVSIEDHSRNTSAL